MNWQGAYPARMDDDSKPLSYFGICEGGEVLMEEVDLKESARERAEAEALREQRIADEEARAAAIQRINVGEARRTRDAAAAAVAGGHS